MRFSIGLRQSLWREVGTRHVDHLASAYGGMPHRTKGCDYLKCNCPVWADGKETSILAID
jgi:hypothetical protein